MNHHNGAIFRCPASIPEGLNENSLLRKIERTFRWVLKTHRCPFDVAPGANFLDAQCQLTVEFGKLADESTPRIEITQPTEVVAFFSRAHAMSEVQTEQLVIQCLPTKNPILF